MLDRSSSLYSDEVNCGDLRLSNNALLSTKYCTSYDTISINDESRMEVTADPDDYPKYKDTYGMGRAITTEHIEIYGYAELSVTNYCHQAIYISDNFGDIKLYDNGKLFVMGNSHSLGIDLDDTAYGTLELNDNSTVSIEGSYVCIISQAININSGTFICNSTKDGAAIIINNRYGDKFDIGININGEIVEQTPSDIEFIPDGDSEVYDIMVSDGNAVISYKVTVKST